MVLIAFRVQVQHLQRPNFVFCTSLSASPPSLLLTWLQTHWDFSSLCQKHSREKHRACSHGYSHKYRFCSNGCPHGHLPEMTNSPHPYFLCSSGSHLIHHVCRQWMFFVFIHSFYLPSQSLIGYLAKRKRKKKLYLFSCRVDE